MYMYRFQLTVSQIFRAPPLKGSYPTVHWKDRIIEFGKMHVLWMKFIMIKIHYCISYMCTLLNYLEFARMAYSY